MKRILLTCEYDGTAYVGWQRQINGLSVQEVIEDTLSQVCHTPIRVTGASRTDAGVHAMGQCLHFDSDTSIPPEKFPFVLNTMLPGDIRIQAGREVPPAFHARFLSCGKTYIYRIINQPHASALWRLRCVHVPVALDLDAMQTALTLLLGTHDFSAFQAAGGTAKTTQRTIDEASLTQTGNLIELHIHGNAFLYNMVRIIAGTLIDIGHHRLDTQSFTRAIQTGDRLQLGPTAPPQGLELHRVDYPPEAFVDPEALRWHTEDSASPL
ncbi:MAG: tRNA pseudouridine(38-40) synthase TruA [Clostridia bacterium]|nr:tRNA pseudouridine(38-40) synthase TruA [Clostridia bacterium]